MGNTSWQFVQANSDIILSEGLWHLLNQPTVSGHDVSYSNSGNYLVSLGDNHYYIGEADSLVKRIKQQFTPKLSTFYKNYEKIKTSLPSSESSIEQFLVRYLAADFGRKELEEFGISNLFPPLNKFQLGKRSKYEIAKQNGIWNSVQKEKEALLREGEAHLFESSFKKWSDSKVNAEPGIYIVKSPEDEFIYIGESSDINERFHTHSNRTYFSALRRHIGTELLKFELKERNGKRKYFTEQEDDTISFYLKECNAIFYRVMFGRYEFEDYLIKKHRPILNRKGNK